MNAHTDSAHEPAASQGTLARLGRSLSLADRARTALRRHGIDAPVAWTLLVFAVAINLAALHHEVSGFVPAVNDMVMHGVVFERTVLALETGQNPTDMWMGTIPGMGYPLFHYYQHLPYVLVAAISRLLTFLSGSSIPAAGVLGWSGYLLLSAFPLSIYWAMRRFGFSRLEAALAGLASSLVSTNFLYGLEYGSYIWRGNGMYTQLWGMLLLPMALAQSFVVLRHGRGYTAAVLLVAATVLSHVVSGYVALLSLVLLALVAMSAPSEEPGSRRPVLSTLTRLSLLLLPVALVVAYYVVPFLRDSQYMNRSVWELQEKYDSFGAPTVLRTLLKGDLLDYGRFPVISLLAFAGLGVSLVRWRWVRYRIPVALALFWLLLYFGRPTWGVLLKLLPMSGDLHLHRLIMGFHLGAIMLSGIALAIPWSWAIHHRDRRMLLLPIALTALLLAPVYVERAQYLDLNKEWRARSAAAYAAEADDLAALENAIKAAPAGRVYAGLKAKWGGDYRVGDVPVYGLLSQAGFDVVGGLYQALSLNSDIQVLFDDGLFEQYNLFNIRYVLTPTDWTVPSFYRTLGDFGRHRLYEIPTTGYFDLVDSELAFAGDKSEFYPAASAWLHSRLVAARQHPRIYLDGAPAGETVVPLVTAPQVLAGASIETRPAAGRVTSETVESNSYSAVVEVTRDSYLMLKATYHPTWHATIDGAEAPTVMLMPSYVAARVAPGTHHVRMEYRPQASRSVLMALSLMTLAAVAAGERWRTRRRRPAGPIEMVHHGGGTESMWARLERAFSQGVWSSLRTHLPYIGGTVALAVLAGLPLFQLKMMSGHDAPEYLTRAVEFTRGLEAGQIFPRWAPDLNFGYGEPFFSFNPPLIYYLMAFFRMTGAGFVAAQDWASFLILVTGSIGIYLLVSEPFGKRAGLVSAAAYLFASYLLAALYVRQALADYSAFASLPFAFWGLYCYARSGRYRYLLAGSCAISVIMLSSNPVSLMTVPSLVAWAGWLVWHERNWTVLRRGLTPIAFGLGLSAFFWTPAFVEREMVQTASLFEGYLNYRNHFVYASQYVNSPWGYGLSLAGTGDGMSFALGPVHLLTAIAAILLLWWKRGWGTASAAIWLGFYLSLLGGALFLASNWSQPLWDALPLIQYLEFPWRFLSLAALSLAVLCGVVFQVISTRSAGLDRRLPDVLLAVTLVALLAWGLPRAAPETYLELNEADHSPQAIAARGIAVTTAGEYAPVWVKERPQAQALEPLTLVAGHGRVLGNRLSVTTQEYEVEVGGGARFRLNTFYFPGWTLYVDGTEQTIEYDNPQGLMEFSLPDGRHDVTVAFEPTPVRFWATVLSQFVLLLLLAIGVAGLVIQRVRVGRARAIQDSPTRGSN